MVCPSPRSTHGAENPVLDLALVLKLIGSDCYWYRTCRPQLPGISRWQIDSLRELRNRVAHNDGEDPLFSSASLVLPYLNTMEQLLHVVGSEKANDIIRIRIRIRSGLQRRRRLTLASLVLGRSRWSVPFWFASVMTAGSVFWLVDYLCSPRIERAAIVIGTPDQRLDRYRSLEQHLESKLRPAQFLRALRGEKVAVRVEAARSYPEAVAHLRARRWDVLLGFSPVVSMESINVGYRPIGLMFPGDPDCRSIVFARRDSSLRSLNDITPATRVALGDFFSATKYYVPMSTLQGRSGQSDGGAMAGHPQQFERINPGLRVFASSAPLPQSLVARSPSLGDLDRDRLNRPLLEKSAVFRVLSDLNGRFVRVIALRHLLNRQLVVLETPHQLDISP